MCETISHRHFPIQRNGKIFRFLWCEPNTHTHTGSRVSDLLAKIIVIAYKSSYWKSRSFSFPLPFARHSVMVFLVMLNEAYRSTFFLSLPLCLASFRGGFCNESSKCTRSMHNCARNNKKKYLTYKSRFFSLSPIAPIPFAKVVFVAYWFDAGAQFSRSNVIIKLIIISERFHFLNDCRRSPPFSNWASIDVDATPSPEWYAKLKAHSNDNK